MDGGDGDGRGNAMTKWYWNADTYGEECYYSVGNLLDAVPLGEVTEITVAEPRTIYAVELEPAPDDQDEARWIFEAETAEECQAAMEAELNRRAWCLSWGGI